MKIYLASPFFNKKERENVEIARDILRARGFEVFVPMEHKIENGEDMPNDEWGRAVYNLDIEAMDEVDIICALYYGLYSDSGTAYEIGYAKCLGKKVVVVDLNAEQETSLMVVNGADVNLSSLDELKKYDFENFTTSNFTSHKPQK